MALPFKNGFELAQAMGFGKMYQASKEQNENNIQAESKKMNKKLIRLTESDLHGIVKESVQKILKEIGDTPQGQYLLGRAYQRRATGVGGARESGKLGSKADPNKAREIQNYANLNAKRTSDPSKNNAFYSGAIDANQGYEATGKVSDAYLRDRSTVNRRPARLMKDFPKV